MQIRFLLDENLSPLIKQAVLQYDDSIDILRVGDEGAPPLSTPDPDILIYLEATDRVLVTDNRASMPEHIRDHFAAGHEHPGIFWLRDKENIGLNAEWICTL